MKPKKIKYKLGKRQLPTVTKLQTSADVINNFPVDHYSYSSMVDFSTNPILFRIKHINRDRFETTKNISAVVGKAFHYSMEIFFGNNPDMLPKDEPQAIEFGLKAGLDYLEKYNDGFIEYSDKIPNKQAALERFSFLFTSYVKDKRDTSQEQILGMEMEICEKVSVVWRGRQLDLPVKLKGFIDKLIRRNEDGRIVIRDYKTCASFSDPDKIDGAKILQAVEYYLLVYALLGEEPYSMEYEEARMTKNKEGGRQVKEYEIVYAKNELYFDFYFRFYEDMTDALNGKMVYVPNVKALYDNEVAIISYVHRLDIPEEKAKEMSRMKVDNITDVLKKKIQNAGNMRKLLKTIEEKFAVAKNIDYKSMSTENKIQTKLMEFGMVLQFDSKIEGASVDLYQYTPSIGLKMSRLGAFVADIEQVTGKSGIRALAPIPGTNLVGFEVPREVRKFPNLPTNQGYSLAIGQTIMGEPRWFDIRTAPHLLVAGSTGSGKSVFLHSMIKQLKNTPAKMILIDPKQVEFAMYKGAISERQEIAEVIAQLAKEMNQRYSKLKAAGHRDAISAGWDPKFLVIDEYADLILTDKPEKKAVKTTVTKSKGITTTLREQEGADATIADNLQIIAQKGRAAGIHIILATQRASTRIISGDIKVNFPVKVVFKMAKEADSRVMLDEAGAEKLLGKGDCLFASDAGMERLQAYNI